MLAELSGFLHIYIACGRTNIRKSIDGLAAIVAQNFHLDPFEKNLFLFCGRKRDKIKGLLWEGDGFLLLYKKLEGGTFNWPKDLQEVLEITPYFRPFFVAFQGEKWYNYHR
ncbi:MAG TPA: IS66 family insertion sequence element accessory protein TnpB [Anaerovoracaceae bacterium]|nr:IS66 family insertion sequence element accessory protein TnpB [Anaerovoracaceae bacterium]